MRVQGRRLRPAPFLRYGHSMPQRPRAVAASAAGRLHKAFKVYRCMAWRLLTPPRSIQLTPEQARIVSEWAKQEAPKISEVRLFGSRARACSRPNSDVDLAVTLGGSPKVVCDLWITQASEWEEELCKALRPLTVHLYLYNSSKDPRVRRYCRRNSAVLFPASTSAMMRA
jgi:predicted nucleotidyltransferase